MITLTAQNNALWLTDDEASQLQAKLICNQLRKATLTELGTEGVVARLDGSGGSVMIYSPIQGCGVSMYRRDVLERLSQQRAAETTSYAMTQIIDYGVDYVQNAKRIS